MKELTHLISSRPACVTAWRSYFPYTDDSRCFLCNERSHEFLLLEGVSADLWHMLVSNSSLTHWQQFLLDNDIGLDELAEFLDELADAGLITSTQPEPDPSEVESPQSSDVGDEARRLETDMKNWVESKGLVYAVHWEMTYRCNEVCVHCFNPGAAHEKNEKPQRETNELSTAEAKKLLNDMASQGVFRLTLTGGEVTLRKDFMELLAYARGLGFMVVLFTNGLKIRDRVIADISALWPHGVEISIYSHIPEKHDAITGVNGSFARSLLTLEKFRQAGIRTTFKSTLMKSTASDYAQTRALGEQSADTVILTTMMAPGVDGKKAPLNQALSFEQLVGLAATPDSPLYVGSAIEGWRKASVNHAKMKPCGAGHASLAITPDGNILPCLAFPMKLGNVRDAGLSELLHHAPTFPHAKALLFDDLLPTERLAAWQEIRLADLRECGTHERCLWCGDICPGDAYVQTRDPLAAAENHCREAYARMTAARELESGLNQTAIYTKYGVNADFGDSAPAEQPIKWHPSRNAIPHAQEEISS